MFVLLAEDEAVNSDDYCYYYCYCYDHLLTYVYKLCTHECTSHIETITRLPNFRAEYENVQPDDHFMFERPTISNRLANFLSKY